SDLSSNCASTSPSRAMVWQLFSASLSSSGARSSAQRPVAGTSRSLSLAGDTEANSRQHRLRMWLVRIMGIQGAHTGRRFRRPAHYGITRAWVTKPFGPEGFIGGGCPALLATRRSGIPAGALSEAPPAGTGSLLQLGKGPLGRVQGDLQLGLAMGDGGEARLEGRGRQVYAAFQHQVEEAVEALGIAGHHVGEGLDAVGPAEVQAEHGANLGGHERDAGGIGAILQALQHAAGVVGQLVMEAGTADQLEGGQAGGHGQ